MSKYEIHISDMTSFKECRRKWHFSSLLQLGLERDVVYPPFFTGRAVHYCLEQYYEHWGGGTMDAQEFMRQELARFLKRELEDVNFENLWEDERTKIEEQIELISGMLDHYVIWTRSNQGPWMDSNLEFIALETEFSVPLRNPETGRPSSRVYLAGRFDGLVKRRDNGTYWLWETKTARTPKELIKTLGNSEQTGAYIYAAQELTGQRISGVLYNILRKKVPTQPRILNNGMLSVAKQIDTTAQYYLAAVRAHHQGQEGFDNDFIIKHYGDIIQHLLDKEQESPFFVRIPVRRTIREIESLHERVWQVALEMVRPSTPLYTNASWKNCGNCPFQGPCIAWEAGGDYEAILRAEYRPRRVWDALVGHEIETEDYNGANQNG